MTIATMSPASAAKPKSFTFTLTTQEHAALEKLASADDRSAASWLRLAIRRAYVAQHGEPAFDALGIAAEPPKPAPKATKKK